MLWGHLGPLISHIFMFLVLIGWERHLSSINSNTYIGVIISTNLRRKNISRLACKYVSLINAVVQSIVPDLEQMLGLHQKIFDLNEVELEKMKSVHSSDLPMTCQIHTNDNFKGLGLTTVQVELWPRLKMMGPWIPVKAIYHMVKKVTRNETGVRDIPNLLVCTPPKSGTTNWQKFLWQLKYLNEQGILVDADDKKYINFTNLYQAWFLGYFPGRWTRRSRPPRTGIMTDHVSRRLIWN